MMKFLCIACDEPMKLIRTAPPDRGSLTVVFRCGTCGHEIAMLTNPLETKVVGSLGVKIGGEAVSAGEAESGAAQSKCPFSATAREMGLTNDAAGSAGDGMPWTGEALARLGNIPEFVRPMAKTGIEKFAMDNGRAEVDEQVLDEAKDFFGM